MISRSLFSVIIVLTFCDAKDVLSWHADSCPNGHAHIADNFDCHAFYHCMSVGDGTSLFVRKSCGKFLMFHPETQTCDWPFRVRYIRPECKRVLLKAKGRYTPISTTTTTTTTTTTPRPAKSKTTFETTLYYTTTIYPIKEEEEEEGFSKSKTLNRKNKKIFNKIKPNQPKSNTILRTSSFIPQGKFNLNSLKVFTSKNITQLQRPQKKNSISKIVSIKILK